MSFSNTFIAIDLKSFYASVECRERGLDPLTTNLVVADSSRTEKTICLAISPNLKRYGIKSRSRLFQVIQKVKEIERTTGKVIEYITAPPRMALYVKYSADIYQVYLKFFAPEDIHVYSIDEVFIDVTQYLPLYKKSAQELCAEVLQEVLSTTGITATAGIAPNLYLCKIAMDIVAKHIPANSDGAKIATLDEISYRKTLWGHKPLTDFWQIGTGTCRRLEKNALFTMGDIARMSLKNPNYLYKLFGINAEILIDHAWGYEPCTIKHIKTYKPIKNSLGSGQVLQRPYPINQARLIVQEMAEHLSFELVEKQLATNSFTLVVCYDGISLEKGYEGPLAMDSYGRIYPKPTHGTINLGEPTYSISKISINIAKLFDKITHPDLFVRRINLCANNVIPIKKIQPSLFDQCTQEKKDEQIQKAILNIHKRYGKNSLLKGHDLQKEATTMERNMQIGGHKA
ncbi:MAG: DNA methylase [Spirochaetaceae bacterium]|nr:DNA methylase [Spirochaetaceae bacterium]